MEMSLAKVANAFTAKNDGRSKKFWNPSIEIPNAATEDNDTLLSRGLGGNRIYWPRPEYVLEKAEALAEDFSSTHKGRGQ